MNKDIGSWLRARVPDERQVCRLSTVTGIYEVVKAGAGVGILPSFVVSEEDDLVPLSDENISPHLSVRIGGNRDFSQNAVLRSFVDHIKVGISETLRFESL